MHLNTYLSTTYDTCMTSTVVPSFIIIQYLLNYKTKINQIECELLSNWLHKSSSGLLPH